MVQGCFDNSMYKTLSGVVKSRILQHKDICLHRGHSVLGPTVEASKCGPTWQVVLK